MVRWPEQSATPEQSAYLAGFADLEWFRYSAQPGLVEHWLRGRKAATTGLDFGWPDQPA